MPLRFASFFSGALGLDLGFEQAGWECVCANELDKTAIETIRLNRPDLRLYAGDIRDLSAEQVLSDSGLRRGEIDAVIGGPPCQAFSTAGRRRSFDDDRGSLALHFLDLAIALQPNWIVLENVRGLLSAPLRHRPHSERGPGHPPLTPEEGPRGALTSVYHKLFEGGYLKPTWKLYDASRYGVPQKRERLIIIATRGDCEFPHIPAKNAPQDAPSFRMAVSGLRSEEWLPLRAAQEKYLPLLAPGQNWRNLQSHLWPDALGGAFMASGGRVGFLRRVAWDEPCPTLVTCPTMPATLLAHPEELRPLSVEEYRRIQGFPDDWRLVGSTAQKYKQLGNAVPVALGQTVAEHLRAPSCSVSGLQTSRYSADSEADWLEWHLQRQMAFDLSISA